MYKVAFEYSSEARSFGLLKKRSLQPLRLCYSADLNATPLKHGAEGIPIDPGQVHVQRYKDQSNGKSTGIQECVDSENVHKYRREYSNRERHESIYQKGARLRSILRSQ